MTVGAVSHCSTGTPDSPVNYSGSWPQKSEGEEFGVARPWCTGHCPVRQTREPFGMTLALYFEPNFGLFNWLDVNL